MNTGLIDQITELSKQLSPEERDVLIQRLQEFEDESEWESRALESALATYMTDDGQVDYDALDQAGEIVEKHNLSKLYKLGVYARYHCSGQMSSGEDIYICQFIVTQYCNGHILIKCSFDNVAALHSSKTNIVLQGMTESSQQIEITGSFLTPKFTHSHNFDGISTLSAMLTSSGKVTVKIGKISNASRLCFALTNLAFDEINYTSHTIQFELEEVSFIIRKIAGYKIILDNMKQTKNANVTCELIVELDKLNIDEIYSIVDHICNLLTIAKGKRINWICYRGINDNNQIVYIEHQERITSPYAGFELIDKKPPDLLPEFIETCYPAYSKLDSDYNFHSIANIYSDIRSSVFLETRSLALVALVDSWTKKLKLTGDLAQRLKQIGAMYDVPITEAECEDFRDFRNMIAHELSFDKNSTEYEQYGKALHFFDRLLLRILDYTGYYLPITEFLGWVGEKKHELTPKKW